MTDALIVAAVFLAWVCGFISAVLIGTLLAAQEGVE